MTREQVCILGLSQPADELFLLADHRAPILDIGIAWMPRNRLADRAWCSVCNGPDEAFGRHAANVHEGAADQAMSDERDLSALFGSGQRGREPSRSGANHREVVLPGTTVVTTAAIHVQFPMRLDAPDTPRRSMPWRSRRVSPAQDRKPPSRSWLRSPPSRTSRRSPAPLLCAR